MDDFRFQTARVFVLQSWKKSVAITSFGLLLVRQMFIVHVCIIITLLDKEWIRGFPIAFQQ